MMMKLPKYILSIFSIISLITLISSSSSSSLFGFVDAVKTLTPQCAAPSTPPCFIGLNGPSDWDSSDNQYILSGYTQSTGSLTILTKSAPIDITLTISTSNIASLLIDEISSPLTYLHNYVFNSVTLTQFKSSGDLNAQSISIISSTLNLAHSTAFLVNKSFSMTSSTITTSDTTGVIIQPSVDNVTVSLSSNTMTLTPTASSSWGIRLFPTTSTLKLQSVSISSNTISLTTTGIVAAHAILLSGDGSSETSSLMFMSPPSSYSSSYLTVSSNKINVTTSSGASVTGIAVAASSVLTADFTSNMIGVTSTGSSTATSTGLALYATEGNYWTVSKHNVESSCQNNAVGLQLNGASWSSASLTVSESYFRVHASTSGAADGVAFSSSLTNIKFRFELSVVYVTIGASGPTAARLINIPTFSDATVHLGNITGTATTYANAISLPTVTSGTSNSATIRCVTINNVLYSPSTTTYSYVTNVACATCSVAVDCNSSTTSAVSLETSTGKCLCSCNSDSAITAWLPVEGQCSGVLAIAPPTTTFPNTTIVDNSSVVTEDDTLPYETILGLSIFGIICGLILLIVLTCCLCKRYCTPPGKVIVIGEKGEEDEEEEEEEDEFEEGYDDEGNPIMIQKPKTIRKTIRKSYASMSSRPSPPPPQELCDLRRLRYIALKDKRMMQALLEEIDQLRRLGEVDRANALEAELKKLQQEYNELRAEIGKETPVSIDADDDITVTPAGGYLSEADEEDDPLKKARMELVSFDNIPNRHLQTREELEEIIDSQHKQMGDNNMMMKSPDSVDRLRKLEKKVGDAERSIGIPADSNSNSPFGSSQAATTATDREPFASNYNSGQHTAYTPSPIEEYYGRPRLSRTSPFRFTVTPTASNPSSSTFPQNNQHHHQPKDCVGAMATNTSSGGLKVVALRGGSSSDEEEPTMRGYAPPSSTKPIPQKAPNTNWRPPTPTAVKQQQQQQQTRSSAPPPAFSPPAQISKEITIPNDILAVPPPASSLLSSSKQPKQQNKPVSLSALATPPPRKQEQEQQQETQTQQTQSQQKRKRSTSPLRVTAEVYMENQRNQLSPQQVGTSFFSPNTTTTTTSTASNSPAINLRNNSNSNISGSSPGIAFRSGITSIDSGRREY